jgi:predicted nuclease of predicted toxin-antitoxin system
MLKFIVDTQLQPMLANFLSNKGFNAIHTTYFPDGHLLQDAEILVIATDEERIVTTKDKDFLEHFMLKGSPPKVLLLQFGNIKNSDLITAFEEHISEIAQLFEEGANFVIFGKTNIVSY